jgi:hypothetical protein
MSAQATSYNLLVVDDEAMALKPSTGLLGEADMDMR